MDDVRLYDRLTLSDNVRAFCQFVRGSRGLSPRVPGFGRGERVDREEVDLESDGCG